MAAWQLTCLKVSLQISTCLFKVMMMKKIGVFLLLVMFLSGCGSSDVSNKIGDEAYNISFESYDGTQVHLEDYRGKTVYLLAWTTT